MKDVLNTILYYLFFSLWYVVSLLPLRIHYFFSDATYSLLYYLIRYRRRVVREHLTDSFPGTSSREIRKIE